MTYSVYDPEGKEPSAPFVSRQAAITAAARLVNLYKRTQRKESANCVVVISSDGKRVWSPGRWTY